MLELLEIEYRIKLEHLKQYFYSVYIKVCAALAVHVQTVISGFFWYWRKGFSEKFFSTSLLMVGNKSEYGPGSVLLYIHTW